MINAFIFTILLAMFPQARPYDIGYNFEIAVDSVAAQREDPLIAIDSVPAFRLVRGQTVVIAQFLTLPTDSSVWVQVGTYIPAKSDSISNEPRAELLWLHEDELISNVVPDKAVSKLIHGIVLRHKVWLILSIGLLLFLFMSRYLQRHPGNSSQPAKDTIQIMLLDAIPTMYPSLLAILVAAMVCVAQSIDGQTWTEFYFSPTLNPFATHTPGIAIVLVLLWAELIIGITSVAEAYRSLPANKGIVYIMTIPCVCTLIAWLFSRDMPIWLMWTLFLAFTLVVLRDYKKHARAKYACGRCGAKLHSLGPCPKCGANNI